MNPPAAENSPPLPRLPAGAAIAILRLRSLGDTLLMTPALAALKRWRPDLRLTALVEPRFVAVLAGNPDLDGVIELSSGPVGRCRALQQLRATTPALTLSLHGGATAAWMARAGGAPLRAGFLGWRHGWAYNLLAPPAPPPPDRPRLHTVEHVASLLYFLGLPPAPLGPARIFPDPTARAKMRARLDEKKIGRFAFLSVNPRSFTMRWPAEKFHALSEWLWEQHGMSTVMASPSYDVALEKSALSAHGTILSGISTTELIGLQAEAALMVGCDGGPVHIAAALGTPLVAIFSSTDSVVWAPWQARARVVRNPIACNPCPADRCYQFDSPRCIESVTLQQVRTAVKSVLKGE